MRYFKYITIILVTIWVIFCSNSNAQDFQSNDYNKSRMTYFQTKAKIERYQKDIYHYKAQKLALMSNGDFKSKTFKRISSSLEKRERDVARLQIIKNNSGVFSCQVPKDFIQPVERNLLNE
jgi:hypothetical protein